jgi:hypothetical protein
MKKYIVILLLSLSSCAQNQEIRRGEGYTPYTDKKDPVLRFWKGPELTQEFVSGYSRGLNFHPWSLSIVDNKKHKYKFDFKKRITGRFGTREVENYFSKFVDIYSNPKLLGNRVHCNCRGYYVYHQYQREPVEFVILEAKLFLVNPKSNKIIEP